VRLPVLPQGHLLCPGLTDSALAPDQDDHGGEEAGEEKHRGYRQPVDLVAVTADLALHRGDVGIGQSQEAVESRVIGVVVAAPRSAVGTSGQPGGGEVAEVLDAVAQLGEPGPAAITAHGIDPAELRRSPVHHGLAQGAGCVDPPVDLVVDVDALVACQRLLQPQVRQAEVQLDVLGHPGKGNVAGEGGGAVVGGRAYHTHHQRAENEDTHLASTEAAARKLH